ncbi:Aryl carrier domain-containing protein [Prosthecobacter debontii]|uniref:Aryl carrier domain-containing protein n=1 Tax=Prosthecobacter debontii TaxID=48467 RepID=A0A1T4WI80_9BACT|nr:acyl carrier protein [Prosthecobacter debontii]SKA77012.1 Aryl carrier domain-containing protein [Prosthecobacter debontii]
MSDISPHAVIGLIVHHHIVEADEPLTPESDLFACGLDSLAMMQLMLHLESEFKVRIDPAQMTRNHFATPTVLAQWLSHPNRSAA